MGTLFKAKFCLLKFDNYKTLEIKYPKTVIIQSALSIIDVLKEGHPKLWMLIICLYACLIYIIKVPLNMK